MRFLLDTHLLIRVADGSKHLSEAARALIEDPSSRLAFRTASLWEIAIEHSLRRADFQAAKAASSDGPARRTNAA